MFVIASGIGIEGPIGMSWAAVNYPDLTVRAVVVAFVSMAGNTGSVIASFLYTTNNDDPLHSKFPFLFSLSIQNDSTMY